MGCRVAPARCRAGALTRSGRGDRHHPVLLSARLEERPTVPRTHSSYSSLRLPRTPRPRLLSFRLGLPRRRLLLLRGESPASADAPPLGGLHLGPPLRRFFPIEEMWGSPELPGRPSLARRGRTPRRMRPAVARLASDLPGWGFDRAGFSPVGRPIRVSGSHRLLPSQRTDRARSHQTCSLITCPVLFMPPLRPSSARKSRWHDRRHVTSDKV
jgi:hypothetical protein